MKPGTRATISTLSIAVTRPMKSTVSVICRLATGVTETAGGGAAPWAVATRQEAIKLSAQIAAFQGRELLRPGIEVSLLQGSFRRWIRLTKPGAGGDGRKQHGAVQEEAKREGCE